MNNELTAARIAYLIDVYAGTTVHPALVELQERRKADSAVPVAYISQSNLDSLSRGHDAMVKCTDNVVRPVPLYTAPPAPIVPQREQVRREHAEWSQATFGGVGTVGPLKHLSKEALEVAAEPGDLSEWADMQFLLWDAQRRAGITDEQITLAMIEKLAINKQREWPEPKDGEPRLHIKEPPAPVVPEELLSAMEEVLRVSDRDHEAWHKVRNGIAACRAVQPVSAPALNVYERIYGPLRKCPGPDSIYSATPSVGERVPHGICAHAGCVDFYCEFGHLHLEPVPYPGCHAHSLNGGKNDA